MEHLYKLIYSQNENLVERKINLMLQSMEYTYVEMIEIFGKLDKSNT